MALLEKLTSRALSRLGLNFDFTLDLKRDPFDPITPTLLLGSRPRRDQVEGLTALGVTHVVSCLDDTQRPAVAFLHHDFETLFLSVRDGVVENIEVVFPDFFDFVDRAEPNAKVLVHCEVGVSRSATLATAHVMKTDHLRFYEAYRQVRARRAQVLPNVGFASQLQRFENTLFPEPRPDGYASLTRYLREVCNVPVEMNVLQSVLEQHEYDALPAIRTIFGGEVPRVVQGMRL